MLWTRLATHSLQSTEKRWTSHQNQIKACLPGAGEVWRSRSHAHLDTKPYTNSWLATHLILTFLPIFLHLQYSFMFWEFKNLGYPKYSILQVVLHSFNKFLIISWNAWAAMTREKRSHHDSKGKHLISTSQITCCLLPKKGLTLKISFQTYFQGVFSIFSSLCIQPKAAYSLLSTLTIYPIQENISQSLLPEFLFTIIWSPLSIY